MDNLNEHDAAVFFTKIGYKVSRPSGERKVETCDLICELPGEPILLVEVKTAGPTTGPEQEYFRRRWADKKFAKAASQTGSVRRSTGAGRVIEAVWVNSFHGEPDDFTVNQTAGHWLGVAGFSVLRIDATERETVRCLFARPCEFERSGNIAILFVRTHDGVYGVLNPFRRNDIDLRITIVGRALASSNAIYDPCAESTLREHFLVCDPASVDRASDVAVQEYLRGKYALTEIKPWVIQRHYLGRSVTPA